MSRRLLFVIVGLLAITAPARAETPKTLFTDVTASSNIDFTHTFGDNDLSSILEATGPGCALLDADGDGDLDLYLINGAHLAAVNDPPKEDRKPSRPARNHLYLNDGNGVFTDATSKAGVGHLGYGMGVAVADYDNDGDQDLFVANYGPNVLYRNNGDGTFEDVSAIAGVAGPVQVKKLIKWSVHAVFLDYDADGWLDLYVVNYLSFDPEYQLFFGPEGFPGPLSYDGQPDLLYRNNGDGTFSDVTAEAGVLKNNGRGMSIGTADVDLDGDTDIFVSNDAMENFLFLNQGDRTFKEVGLLKGVAFGEFGEATSSMAPSFADLDNDGDQDLLVPDMGYSCLYRNDQGRFLDVAAVSGLAEASGQYTSWAPVIFDYDNDGLQDLFITNGDAHHLYSEEDLLLKNLGQLKFRDVSLSAGEYFTKDEYVGRGAAFGDWDNDGDVDLVVVNVGGPAILLRNEVGSRQHWLTVKTVGTRSNRDGLGARVIATVGEQTYMREVGAASGYLSANDHRVYFGLGRATKVDRLEVHWPSGVVQKLGPVKVDQILTVKETKE